VTRSLKRYQASIKNCSAQQIGIRASAVTTERTCKYFMFH